MAASTRPSRPSSQRSFPDPPMWTDPCGIHGNIPPPLRSEIYGQITLQAKLGKEQGDKLKTDFLAWDIKDPEFEHDTSEIHLAWLPLFPEPTESHIDGLDVDETISVCYEHLQRFAVGFEQTIADMSWLQPHFEEDFILVQGKLRQTLCEFGLCMIEYRIKQKPDVTRDLMPGDERTPDSKSEEDTRDWVILRDYVKTLNYIAVVFEALKKKAAAEEAKSGSVPLTDIDTFAPVCNMSPCVRILARLYNGSTKLDGPKV